MSGLYNASHKFCPSFLVAAVIFSVFTLTGIVSAAWVDAPNTPPGYGISGSGCTFPCLEEDFRPMNLGATKQTKQGNIAAGGYYDANDPTGTYFIEPYANGGNSGKLDGSMSIASAPSTSLSVGRVEPYLNAVSAKLIVNNPETAGKYGSTGDAIYAYADSAGAALFAEQKNPLGYAITASGTASYFNSNVEVGSATNPKQLCLSGVCQSAWPSAGSGTTNRITKWTGSNTLGDSSITDNGATVTVGGNLSVTGTANTCKKISYVFTQDVTLVDATVPPDVVPPASTIPNAYCGANYYAVALMNTTGTLTDFGSIPTSGSMICCKNAD